MPIGVFVKIMYGHKAWIGEHKIDSTELAFIAVAQFAHSMHDAGDGKMAVIAPITTIIALSQVQLASP